MVRPEIISLFSGPGGLDLGFKEAGFVTSLAYDIGEAAIATHRYNLPEANALIADLSEIEVREIIKEWKRRTPNRPVGVIGGPPCQSFSVSNVFQKKNDIRHRLPEHYARILTGLNEVFSLDFFVFENTTGLTSSKHIGRFRKFKSLFKKAGFDVFEAILNAFDFNVAQTRKRLFVVGLNKAKYPNFTFEFPKPFSTDKHLTIQKVIGNLPEPVFYKRELTEKDIPYHPNHWCMYPCSKKFYDGSLEPGKISGRSFRVLSWEKPSYTVAYGHREVHIHPNCKRRLSVLESMLLQGFPENYVLKGTLSDQIRLVSDAVPPPVAKAIGSELIKQLGLNYTGFHRGICEMLS